jgi:hypothetical protein
MAPADARMAIANLCAATDVVLMSSTPDDFAEPTHINVRPPADWAQHFATQGFIRRTDVDASFVSPWAVVFARSNTTVPLVVGAYEGLLAPLGRELIAKRRALLEAQRDLSDARDPQNAKIKQVTDERNALAADRELVVADRDRLVTHIEELALHEADLQAERMSRLAMADELVGLRAELAQLRVQTENSVVAAGREATRLRGVLDSTQEELALAKSELDGARHRVNEMTASRTWQIGRAVLLPVRLVKLPLRIAKAVGRRLMGALKR